MTMHNLILIGMTMLMAYALFSDDIEEIVVKPRNKTKIHYCESCRKQKEHIVLSKNLLECPTCYRQIDLKVS
jgi:hypothetical protein